MNSTICYFPEQGAGAASVTCHFVSRWSAAPAIIAVVLCAGAARLRAADEPAADAPGPTVAAVVDGEPVYVAEVDKMLQRLSKTFQPVEKRNDKSRAEVLREIVRQRVALNALKREGGYVTEAEIDKELNKVKALAQSQKATIDEYVARRRISIDTLRNELAWNRAWNKYIEAHLADALEGYFNEHRKDLDGTLVRASHILLRGDRSASEANAALAAKIREEITSGKMTFEEAAKKYSAGPSRSQGGDLGYFPRYGVMIEEFAKPAFALEKGELSQPVSTHFGTHLITVTDIKPGTKQWTQTVEQIKSPASIDLFNKLVDKEMPKAKVEYTGTSAYLKPDTDELVVPSAADAAPAAK